MQGTRVGHKAEVATGKYRKEALRWFFIGRNELGRVSRLHRLRMGKSE